MICHTLNGLAFLKEIIYDTTLTAEAKNLNEHLIRIKRSLRGICDENTNNGTL
jgi:hypothetical protein